MELIRSHMFDLILSDLRMPGVAGLELLAGARAMSPTTPVVIYSAFATSATRIAAGQLGAVEFVEGPIDEQILLDVVQRHRSVAAGSYCMQEAIGPAARRWAVVVMAAASAEQDLPTLADWAKQGNSVATLKKICQVCGVRAGDSLDFARALRIVQRHANTRCDWYNALAIREPSTMLAFLARAGFTASGTVPGIRAFVEKQRFVRSNVLVSAIFEAFRSRGN
jgi:CheY-like chemotaxis protein